MQMQEFARPVCCAQITFCCARLVAVKRCFGAMYYLAPSQADQHHLLANPSDGEARLPGQPLHCTPMDAIVDLRLLMV
jgi:hypothetical protein